MSYEIDGVIRQIEPEQTFASGFSKREFVVTTDERYPQDVKLEFTKDKCAQLGNFKPGDPVRVHFNLRGNEYNGRFFVNLQAWRIEALAGATQGGSTMAAAHARPGVYPPDEDDDDQVPF